MARRLRWWVPGVRYYEVVTKCCGDEMLLRPDPFTVFITALALALACKAFPQVRVVSFCFLSNHMHLVLHVESDQDARSISDFMAKLDQLIAQRINRHRGRHGHFFADRPHIIPILDEAHLEDRMTYTHAQPVHHDLVETVEQWPGLSSFRAVCEGRPCVEATYFDEVRWRDAGAKEGQRAKFTKTASVPLTTPPMWAQRSAVVLRGARAQHERSVRARERRKCVERGKPRAPRRLPKGAHYTTVDPYSRPAPSERRPQPWAHGDDRAVEELRNAYSVMLEAYRAASARFRATGRLCRFPAGTFPPWVREPPTR